MACASSASNSSALALALLTACPAFDFAKDAAYSTCEPTGHGPVVCLLEGVGVYDVGVVEIGIGAFVDAYIDEWSLDDIDNALTHTAIFWGVAHTNAACPCPRGCSEAICAELYGGDDGCPCAAHCTAGGCMMPGNVVAEAWAPIDIIDKHTGEWRDMAPWDTALHHELAHAVEWLVAGEIDYDHTAHPWRYGGPLAERARRSWQARLGYAAEQWCVD